MHVLGAVGPGATPLLERVAPRLDGRVATVESSDGAEMSPRPDGVDGAYALSEDSWRAAGADPDLERLLDDLSARHDYALLSGFPEAAVPTVAIGGADAANVVLEAPDADRVDVDEAVSAAEASDPHVTLSTLVERVKRSPRADRAGAIATFTGRVRAKDAEDDARTTRLTFEMYEGVAEEKMREIESEIADRDGVYEVTMFHRTGVVEDGEDIVFVVVLAGHRGESFRAVEDGIDRLKDEVPIFKKETTVEENFWVHDR
ncbi:bifunctional molybdopterin-guanine dinucleotide biosynthesis protein MobB/MoaE [Halogeometricum pallidum JCM 14848]|uniref:Bifunctional molybdopterin-guanine dinucleotide biosynthesis protein MobB/MoaE n=1 Tax=Halogeometricum pallidum JCM 14848 TaxID=1227487 RepID=M0DF05_HALPD|nr:molybdopterin synthase [Halogeometricum pallidum]ELZ34015.1 bifunctional molybdopterin-guanine dinucleotide biosynthesis protein MobB/MoaE [Halogeometricum pallidum JCM 14848]